MNIKLLFSIMLTSLLCQASVFAAKLDMTFQQPEKYTDIFAGEGHQKKFQKSTLTELEQHFQTLAKKLPDGQILKVTVKDINLAGDVHLGSIKRIRIVKELYYPSITFSYQLLSRQGQVLTSDDIKLKDINFLTGNSLKYRRSHLSYEKKMLDDWFSETFAQ